mmetsp:Transcript_47555/g.42647  ORF Transcript_47555/g.42647 Transcript_47555/m.42647 type:complete len:226 (+) Transcript_47555:107-784(+)|eukprot:CAMPEP_0201563998 /NCGR_PEP_ID=MMETSP0190_2-20130828/1713_1 /ASSEMBLY_ACC=CAM_ASM_000263 /TAXON_ID=37353 /ORGANISM="Rosalina sp." /LENGTH=225 /DNA_ID=CAMNT_0047979537 /DNA_START=94 /DNA_END=771 /DNA_ORIENTATION=+
MAEQKQDLKAELEKIAKAPVKIIGISGSLRKASFNTGLLRYLKDQKLEGIEFEIVSIADLPLFNQDLENPKDESQDPKAVQELRAKVRAADAIFFSSPEYNYGISSPLKNALDWVSRGANGSAIKGKCATIVGGGGGSGTTRGQVAFRQTAVFLDLRLLNKPEVLIKAFEKEESGAPPVDFTNGDLKSDKWKKRLVSQIEALRDLAKKRQFGDIAFKLLCATQEK